MSDSAWIRRLASCSALGHEDKQHLAEAGATARLLGAHESMYKSGDPIEGLFVVLEGLACHFKLLPDGRRQILAYLFPGDMSDPRQLLRRTWDHSLCMISPSRLAALSPDALRQLERRPAIAQAFGRYALTQQAIEREWLVNLGHRTAFERTGHFLCEVYSRLKTVGLVTDYAFELPLTQAEIADTLALSAVHVNRTLMELRRLKLVTFQNRFAQIHDFAALQAAAGFDATYLQPDGPLPGS